MQLSFRYRFEAAHRFLSSASIPCRTPHGHTWYATLNLEYMGKYLNSTQMTLEFSELKGAWKEFIGSFFDHSYLHNFKDPLVELLKDEGEMRLFPFPGDPTTELISLLLFSKMESLLNTQDKHQAIQIASVFIEETPTNHILCTRTFFCDNISLINSKYDGWWNKKDLTDRTLHELP